MIFWFIPDILYCFNFDNIFDLVKSEIVYAFFGLMLIKTFPNCGGFISSPPITETDSVFGYISCIIAS